MLYLPLSINRLTLTEKTIMDKFTTNQFAEDTNAADAYEMREEFRKEQEEAQRIAEWNAGCDLFDRLHDMHGLRGMGY